ncbi:LexA family protein [Cupriavidus sp. 2TAF22]|uniref:LexA family protein n=1 Tax=unclassified Cupriavidus TaxID=2640874 RepID=UPI003F90CFCF
MTIVDIRRQRLQLLISQKYGTQAEFIRQTGMNQGEISGLSRGSKSFGEKKARRIEELAHIPPGWLDQATGSGDLPLFGSADSPADAYNFPSLGNNFETGPDMRSRAYPEISWVQAGMWTEIADNFEPATAQAYHYCHKDLGPQGFVLRVKGYSMTAPAGQSPSFPEGMLLFVNPDVEAQPGKFVIVRRNGNEATFKKLTLVDGELFLEALNPEWPNRFLRLQKDDHICGVIMTATLEL